MASSKTIERLQRIILQRVAMLIQRDLADPRIGILTVTRTKLSKDIAHCTVFYSVLGDAGARSKAAHALEDARGFLQREVGRILKTRVTPKLAFEFDPSIEGSVRISSLLREARDGAADDDRKDAGRDDAEPSHRDDARPC